jgi:hypothetical protein
MIVSKALGNDGLLKLGYEAEAFLQAKDYAKAGKIFEQLSKESLPDWQQDIVLYNLGTVKLAQNKNDEALRDYRMITLKAASTPQIIRSLYINQGIAYLKQAQNSSFPVPSFEMMEKMDFYSEGLNQFKKVGDLDCQLKLLEQEDSISHCSILTDLNTLFIQSKIGFQQAKQLYMDSMLKTKPIWALGLLIKGMQNLDQQIKTVISLKIPDLQLKPYSEYLMHQAESLKNQWEQILNLPLKAEQKSIINEAAQRYQEALKSIQQIKFIQTEQKINTAINNLEQGIGTFEDHQMQRLLLNYQLILLKKEWTISDLEGLIKEQLLMGLTQEKMQSANQYLNFSIEFFKNSELPASEFYLTAAYQTLNQRDLKLEHKPVNLLSELIKKAWNIKKLTQLYAEILKNSGEVQAILKTSQQQLLDESQLFLPIIFEYEKAAFASHDPKVQRCQQQPWDRALPLFDQGYHSASAVLKLFDYPEQAIVAQANTIQNWKEALRLIIEFTQVSEVNSDSKNRKNEQKVEDINEVLRLIQEMQAQDQPLEQSSNQAMLHTW